MQPPVIIIHYHLQPGGVTKVIETQIDALNLAERDYLILTGEAFTGARGVKQIVLPGLNYLDATAFPRSDGKVLYEECQAAVEKRFGEAEVLWLIHNPFIGKSVLYPELISQLALRGEKMLLLSHDFAEDGRPSNYGITAGTETIYPVAPQIHYGFINSRDKKYLEQAGVPKSNTHLLSNAISRPLNKTAAPYLKENLILYPVRGIRRKNIGEFILWSVLAPAGCKFALTLAPVNEKWLPYYKIWESLVEELSLPVQLSCIGDGNAPGQQGGSFEDWLCAASHCFTTSIAEGFGLTFLEPVALKIPLIGRDLPEITCDFKSDGFTMGSLYEKLLVPLSALDEASLAEDLRDGLESAYLSYGVTFKKAHFTKAWKKLTAKGMVDFGNLPEHHQLSLLMKAQQEGYREFFILTHGGDLLSADHWITEALKEPVHSADPLENYSLDAYGWRLEECLRQVAGSAAAPPKWIEKKRVLKNFLAPERFHFLRT